MGGGSSQTIGFRYFMGLHMVICHGPVTTLHDVYVGKRKVFSSGHLPTSVNKEVFLQAAELFGGDEKEGGIFGIMDVEMGDVNQTQNTYLVNQLGSNTPAFKGVTSVVFRANRNTNLGNYISSSGGGYLAAISPYPKPWAFDISDIPGGSFNPTKQDINGGANGGHIIYDCLTNSDWGLGLEILDIDTASFTSSTDTLFDENFSLSLMYAQQSQMEDFIQEILNHVNGVLYNDRRTGKFIFKLIRDNYDVNTLPIFNETNISSLISFERPAFGEMVNEITLKYRKQGNFKDSSITVQDLASIQAQGGVISQSIELTGIDNDNLAAIVAQRELKQKSTPLARVRMIVNREGWDINPGSVVKLTWTDYGITEIVLRVISIDYGTLENGLIGIDAIEDIFALPTNSYLKPQNTNWSDEIAPPLVSPSTRLIELPYFVIETTFAQDQLNLLLDETSILQSIAAFPNAATFNYKLVTRMGIVDFEEVNTGEFSPVCQLTSNLDRVSKTTIGIKNFTGGLGQVIIGGYAYLNGEVLRIDSVDLDNGLLDVGRGYLDSIPQSHLLNDIIYFADSNNAFDPNFYTDSDTLDAKVLTQTSQATLDKDDAVTDTLVMQGRRLKPYNASQIKINNEYFPSVVVDTISILVSWEHQDRTQQLTTNGQDWYEISLGLPEDGLTYTVRYYNNDSSTLLQTYTGLVGTTISFSPPTTINIAVNIRVEVESYRDGLRSLNVFSHVFSYTKPLGVRTLENANIRILENGDRRVLEG